MKQSIHIYVCIPVTITHAKENRKTGGGVFCEHDEHVGYFYKFMP